MMKYIVKYKYYNIRQYSEGYYEKDSVCSF